jgi:hypothetical protein
MKAAQARVPVLLKPVKLVGHRAQNYLGLPIF